VRTCRKCDKAKPLEEFGRCQANRDGLQSFCKACVNAANRRRIYRRRREDEAFRLRQAEQKRQNRNEERRLYWREVERAERKVPGTKGWARRY
jgi:hypothetical protein